MAKRLRGHQKALQLGRAEKQPCKRQKGPDQSALATELLSLWGHGHLSAVKVQRLANAAMLDGASHSEIAALAKAGNFGMDAGNVHKALVTRFCKNLMAPDPLCSQAPCLNPKTSKVEKDEASVCLVHEMFAALAKGDPVWDKRRFGELEKVLAGS